MSSDSDSFLRRGFLKATGVVAGIVEAGTGVVKTREPEDEPSYPEAQVLVGVSSAADDIRSVVADTLPENAEIKSTETTLRYAVVEFPKNVPRATKHDYIEQAEKHQYVRYAEENARAETAVTVDDPKRDTGALDLVNAPEAWDTTFGSSDVTVAIIDTGVDYNHEDLADSFRSDPGDDFADDDDDPAPDADDEGHGTHVAGIAGAVTDNDTGVAGISQSELISGRALDENGSGFASDIADAIRWAADQGADVINLSLGGGGQSSTMKNAVNYAHNNGATLVAAAGNDSENSVQFPAGYSDCIAVSAVDDSGDLASFTNTGDAIELAAPGVGYRSTYPVDDNYVRLNGTSMASPCVAGVAALVIDQWDTDNATTREHLKNTARDTDLGDKEEGAGIVDAQAAVQTEPSGGGGGGGGGGTGTVSDSVSSSLADYSDSDCWTYGFEYDNPSRVDVKLDGPDGADFDLYVNDGRAECPTHDGADHSFVSTDANESIQVFNPDPSVPLYVTVDSYEGGGKYTLRITEYE